MTESQGEGFDAQEEQRREIAAHFISLGYKLAAGEEVSPTEDILLGELEKMFTDSQVLPPGGLPT